MPWLSPPAVGPLFTVALKRLAALHRGSRWPHVPGRLSVKVAGFLNVATLAGRFALIGKAAMVDSHVMACTL